MKDPQPDASAPQARRPTEPSWRADALAASRHSRLVDELPPPLDDRDPDRAQALCAEICRDLLRDLAPALLLLEPAERRRAQALAAYARTLFDFALQRGVEGERLAQINRWEFDLERSLEGDPPGQPVFVAMARAERARPWPRAALAALAGAARRRVLEERPGPLAESPELLRHLAAALAEALFGQPPAAETAAFAGALLHTQALPAEPDSPARRAGAAPLAATLAGGRRLDSWPPAYRRAAVYLRLASLRLLRRPGAPIGAWARVALLARARWLGR